MATCPFFSSKSFCHPQTSPLSLSPSCLRHRSEAIMWKKQWWPLWHPGQSHFFSFSVLPLCELRSSHLSSQGRTILDGFVIDGVILFSSCFCFEFPVSSHVRIVSELKIKNINSFILCYIQLFWFVSWHIWGMSSFNTDMRAVPVHASYIGSEFAIRNSLLQLFLVVLRIGDRRCCPWITTLGETEKCYADACQFERKE